MNAPNSTLSIQQVVLSQAGAAPDGSGDLTLGTLSATTDISGSSTLMLQAADGVSGGVHSSLEHHDCKLLQNALPFLGCLMITICWIKQQTSSKLIACVCCTQLGTSLDYGVKLCIRDYSCLICIAVGYQSNSLQCELWCTVADCQILRLQQPCTNCPAWVPDSRSF